MLVRRAANLEQNLASLEDHLQDLKSRLPGVASSSHDGTCLWKITDVDKKRRFALEDEVSPPLTSNVFYTARYVYLCVATIEFLQLAYNNTVHMLHLQCTN